MAYEAIVEPFQLNPQSRTGNRTRIICLENRGAVLYTTRTNTELRSISPRTIHFAALPLDKAAIKAGTAGIEPAAFRLTAGRSAI